MAIDDQALLALHDRLWAAMVRDSDQQVDPLTIWQPLYIDAIAAVLTRGLPADWAQLAALMREEQPIHPMLLPALAQALEARGRPKRDGRKRKLSPIQELQAAREVNYLRAEHHAAVEAIERVAQRLRVSDAVVKRAYEKRIPPYRRPTSRLRVKTSGRF